MIPRMSSRRGLTDAEVERVRAGIRELLAQHGGNQRKAEQATGIRQQLFSKYLSGEGRPGIVFAEQLARAMGRPESAFREKAAGGDSVERDDRYFNRARAIVAAKALGYGAEAIRRVEGVSLKSEVDLEPEAWLDMIRSEDRRLRFLAPSDARPVTAEPEPPRRSRAELAAEAQRRNAEEADRPRKTGLPPLEKKPKK